MSIITNDSVWATRPEWRLRSLFRRNRPQIMQANQSRLHRPESSTDSSQSNRRFWNVNIEPALFMFSFAAGILIPISSLYLFYARCVEILENEMPVDKSTVARMCVSLDKLNDTTVMDMVEADVAQWRIYTQISATTTVVLSSPVIGAWADYSGRRAPILLCSFGAVIYVTLQFIATFLTEQINVFYMWIASEIICGLVGGLPTLMAQSFAVVSDDARADKSFQSHAVPLRITIASAVQAIGNLLGSVSVSAIEMLEYQTPEQKVFAYQFSFGIAAGAAFGAFLYMLWFLRDTYKDVLDHNTNATLVINQEPRSRSFSPVDSIKGLVEVAFMPREGYLRFCLNFIVASIFVEMMLFDTQITCLFIKRPPFNWSDSTFTNFFLIRFIFFTAGMALLPLIIRKMSFVGRELYMIIFGIGSNIAINMIMAFAKNTNQLLWTLPFAFPTGAIAPGFRILLPKLVPQQQTSRMFAMVTWVMVIGPLFSAMIFNTIYNRTMVTWPGFVFFLQGLLCLGVVVGLCIVYCLLRPMWNRDLLDQELLLPEDEDDEEGIIIHSEIDRSVSVTAVNSADEDGGSEREPVVIHTI
ncbi:unnamed protein product [Bursaphelenchus okinawaensis]|uniref:MFS domain-containing protein n=1 Tax=Bursaphelenchus okinawaensis TaxID=465554 RepID=A0A811L949_9BILA|nr:unnamed protein product [Bursaphelenchus okinawaensis]CAG9119532.1 unnamed protein product [Bursaphelenchus okinawaensis]